MNKIASLGLLLLVVFAPANAFVISIEAPDTVTVGSTFDVQIIGDLGSFGLSAGGLEFLYDSGLATIDDFQHSLDVDPSFSCPGGPPGCLDDPGLFLLAWFGQGFPSVADLIAPDAGPTLMGTFTMTAGPDVGVLDLLLQDNLPLIGGWYASGFNLICGVNDCIEPAEFFGATINIVSAAEPFTVILMLAGFGAMSAARRKRATD